MLPICQVCLRTDRKLQIIDETLSNWHDELCDFATDDLAQFCSECEHLLKRFYVFKEKCILAVKVLKNWKTQKPAARKPLERIYQRLPPTPLGLCNRNNFKIYVYRDAESDSDIQTPSSNHPHIVTIDLEQGEDINPTNNYQGIEYNVIGDNTMKEKDVKVEIQYDTEFEHSETLVYEELKVKNDVGSDNDSGSESSDFDIKQLLNDTALKSDSNSSEDEDLKPKKRKKTLADLVKDINSDEDIPVAKKKRVRHKKPFNLVSLRNMLMARFAKAGEIRDSEGNIIDKECVLNNLDNMHVYTLNQIRNRCSGTTTLTPEAIQVLSRVQKKYGNQYSSVFTIEHLNSSEQILAEFAKREQYEAYVASEHKCVLCYRGFKHRKLLEYHEKMYHDPSQPHLCTVCQMRFRNRHALLKHRNGHRAVFKCKLCPLVTNYRTAMVNHYHQHKGVVYTCELCKGTFKSKSCLSAHMNYMHQSTHICGLCARTFASEVGLAQHRIRKHQNEEMTESADNRTCEYCEAKFVSEEVYQKHLEKSHAEKRDNVYVYKKRNYVVPRNKPKFVCRVCKIIEHSIGRLMWHFKQEHPNENYELLYSDLKKHLCHVCGKGYASITDLNEHKNIHTGAKPYACDKCPKAFHRKINLRNHLERHLPPARECQHCGKKFVSAANLNNHIKMHIGIRRYTCEICAKSFLHRSALNAHVRGVHYHIRRARKLPLKHE